MLPAARAPLASRHPQGSRQPLRRQSAGAARRKFSTGGELASGSYQNGRYRKKCRAPTTATTVNSIVTEQGEMHRDSSNVMPVLPEGRVGVLFLPWLMPKSSRALSSQKGSVRSVFPDQ